MFVCMIAAALAALALFELQRRLSRAESDTRYGISASGRWSQTCFLMPRKPASLRYRCVFGCTATLIRG